MIFTNLEEKNKVLENGLNFFNSIGLFLKDWEKCFSLEKEDFTTTSIWIQLYSLAHDFWEDETIEDIGNTLGFFDKITGATKQGRYTYYYIICVYMHISKDFPKSI